MSIKKPVKKLPFITQFIAFSLIIAPMYTYASGTSIKVIYGDDDRVDVADSNNSLYIKLAKSTAAMIKNSKLKEYNNYQIEVVSKSLEESGVCASESFAKQPAAASCSGFLVAKNMLVTAGHCIRSQFDCDNSSWVFNYKVDYKDQSKVIVEKSDVYKCSRVTSRELESTTQIDYAVIELEKEVVDRRPLKFRTEGKPAVGTELVVIGHPSGLPTKIADGAQVRSSNDVFLVANLDTYGGNSGSAVFNAISGEVEGILVRGDTDYIHNPQLGCRVSNQVADMSGRGEDVTLITAVKGLPEQQEPEPEEPEQEEPEVEEPEEDNSFTARLRRFLRRVFG